jgi:undecaprenyl-diphosphatase
MAIKDKVKLVILGTIFAIIATAVISNMVTSFDVAISEFVYSFRSELLTQIMRIVSFLGSTPFVTGAVIVIFLILWIKRLKAEAVFLAATLLCSVTLNNILKYSIQRLRPDVAPLENASFYSFPSGHAMNSLVFYGLLAYLAHHWIKNKRLLFVIDSAAIILVLLIGVSRVYLGAHYSSDVVSGIAAGLFVFYVAIILKKNLTRSDLIGHLKGQTS